MIKNINSYLSLSTLFSKKGFHLYLVGGSVRDILLHKEVIDFDVATDANPEEVISVLDSLNYNDSFKKYGVIKLKYQSCSFDIASFRKEKSYKDYRHPKKIQFVKKMKIDYKRRDFTLNALYMDDKLKIYDFTNGQKDIENKIIRMVGCPIKRIKEDPLRIFRAIRFSVMFDFSIEKKLDKVLKKYSYLVSNLNKEKIKQESKKVDKNLFDNYKKLLCKYNINKYIDISMI
ncbi:MAG: CCA tRNA nucleotidyltransferase [Bacilli bacterium]